MTAAELKARVCQTIDAHAAKLEALARQIFAQPEFLGGKAEMVRLGAKLAGVVPHRGLNGGMTTVARLCAG